MAPTADINLQVIENGQQRPTSGQYNPPVCPSLNVLVASDGQKLTKKLLSILTDFFSSANSLTKKISLLNH